MSEELLPCPFCGADAAMTTAMGESWVVCEKCNASGDMCNSEEAAAAAWNARDGRTCRFEPEVCHSYWDEDGEEHETDLADGECEYLLCSECGQLMHEAWFEFERQECGGLSFEPQFRFCPYCGARAERK